MAIETTSTLTNALRTNYSARYIRGAKMRRLYDMFAAPVEREGVERAARLGQTFRVNFLSAMTPGVTAISETADVTPQTLRDAYAEISPTSRGEAIQFAEKLEIDAYTDYTAKAYEMVGDNQMESVEILAYISALSGGFVQRDAARASLDAGTNKLTDTLISEADTMLRSLKCPGFAEEGANPTWFALMHPSVFHDLRLGGNIVSIAQYQNAGIILNSELGQIGPFRLIVSPFSKVFGGAGADNATNIATTLDGAVNALAKQMDVASGTNIAQGMWLTIGTEETSTLTDAGTFYPTNERVYVQSVSSNTITFIGEGENGGLRYDHASGVAVRNADSVYPVVYGGPVSMAKAYDAQTGEYGMPVGPKTTGMLDQFNSLGWKFYGGYGRWVESWILRGEYASSLDA